MSRSVAVITSVSDNIRELAALTVPNKFEYCLRHGYSLVVDNEAYDVAVGRVDRMCSYLDRFDLVWTLDCDALITNMATPIHELPCLGPHLTVCEEGVVPWNRVNCGSVVWRNTFHTRWLATSITALQSMWRPMVCGWQTWLGNVADGMGDIVTIAPIRSFNSCVWNKPGGGDGEPGSHWQPGDLVYHPCGVFPADERMRWITRTLSQVQR